MLSDIHIEGRRMDFSYGKYINPSQERGAVLAILCQGARMVSSSSDLLGREKHASPTGHNTHESLRTMLEKLRDILTIDSSRKLLLTSTKVNEP